MLCKRFQFHIELPLILLLCSSNTIDSQTDSISNSKSSTSSSSKFEWTSLLSSPIRKALDDDEITSIDVNEDHSKPKKLFNPAYPTSRRAKRNRKDFDSNKWQKKLRKMQPSIESNPKSKVVWKEKQAEKETNKEAQRRCRERNKILYGQHF